MNCPVRSSVISGGFYILFKIKTYDEDTGYGLLRHVLVRRGFHSGEVMVVLVLGSPVLPSKNHFVKALRNFTRRFRP